jgi:alpha-N-arabinofuranosidase
MASYAPLLAHAEAWQWKPDAIWFDNLRSFGTTDYYVQRLFGSNTGTRILSTTSKAESNLYTSATLDERTHEVILKAINNASTSRSIEIKLSGVTPTAEANVTTLESTDLSAENSFDHPTAIAPQTSTLNVKSATILANLQPYSVVVYRIPLK